MRTKSFFYSLIFCFIIPFYIYPQQKVDTTTYKSYSGKVLDSETKKPLVFANIYLNGSGIGTVTNSEGEFILKVPANSNYEQIAITFIGYKNKLVNLSDWPSNELIIYLEPTPIQLDEVIIRNKDPFEIVRAAIRNIKNNYPNKPERLMGFYREYIKQNRYYVEIAEAVLDVYKSSYTNEFENDRVKLYKGRKSQDVKRMDTVIFKFQGGPRTSFLLDVVKNPGNILSPEMLEYYNYKLSGITKINNREAYIISFKQKSNLPFALYQGNIYIDIETLAITGIDFQISPESLDLAVNELVRKKPVGMKVNLVSANYLVNYLQSDNKWYINHVKSEIVFQCKWEKRLFKSTYTTAFEMVVTDRDTINVEKFKQRESVSMSDVLIDQVDYFSDENFWEDYNIIKPDENIEAAIKRLSRKLKFK